MARAEIDAGICGFRTTVIARMAEDSCRITIESDCEAIRQLAEALTEVDPFQEISFRGEGPLTLHMAARYCNHPACLVPVGIIKAVEIASGLALPKDAVIRLSSTDGS